jgi:outer membrane protein assembly factor BamA
MLAVPASGCVKKLYTPDVCDRPDRSGCVIDEVEIQGNENVPADNIKEKIATRETNTTFEKVPLLSIWDKLTVEYEKLDPYVLERDLQRIERYYKSLGYYEAHVRAGRVYRKKNARVSVEIAVDEGKPVKVAKVDLVWAEDRGPARDLMFALTTAQTALLKPGANLDESAYEQTKKQLARILSDNGFAYAQAKGKIDIDLVKREANIVYTLSLGPKSRFGPIRFTGLGSIPEAPLRAAIDMKEGDTYSTAKLDSAVIAISNFGVVGAVDWVADMAPEGKSPDPVIPITFKSEPTPLRVIRLGMGAEVGDRVEIHGLVGWENRNFFGGLRHFTVDARPGFILYPMQLATLFSQPPTRVLPQLLVRTELRQPLWFSPRIWGIIGGSFNFYRLPTADPLTENTVHFSTKDVNGVPILKRVDDNIVGYREVAGRVGLERVFWDNRQYVGGFYNIQFDNPFSYNFDDPPEGFQNLLVSYVDLTGTLDLRRNSAGKLDKLHPNSGVYFSNNLQIAGYIFGGDASDVRIRPEFRAYIPISKKVTLAYRAAVGLLFPKNYGDSLTKPPPRCTGEPNVARARDLQLLQFRAFFSGGPSSNRGYPFNGVGPQEEAFLTEGEFVDCTQQLLVATGGLTLWESSLELRFPLIGKLGSVVFLDASDVTRETGHFRLTAPHLSTGIGLRYDTPVGPLRADVGYRIPCAQVISSNCRIGTGDVTVREGKASTLFGSPGVPATINIAIGEAF